MKYLNLKVTKGSLLTPLTLIFLIALNNNISATIAGALETPFKNRVKFLIIKSANNTWGYDVYIDNKKVIHQTSIPGIAGINGFLHRQQAIKVARFVAKKIERGEFPPTVTISELQKLHAI